MNKCVCFIVILLLFAVSFSAGCVSTSSQEATPNPTSTQTLIPLVDNPTVSSVTNTPTSVPTKTVVPTEPIDVEKEQALKSAISYLKYSSFSYEGLLEQLEYEKFTHEQAVYGADNCGANWFEQALKSAKSYLKYSSFSYEGLIEQLEYEKFTHEQAVYGADNCGANWFEQADKSAASYLKYSSFSYEGLIEQLEYEMFTHEQAVYGAEQNF
jgi:hypothetical protein